MSLWSDFYTKRLRGLSWMNHTFLFWLTAFWMGNISIWYDKAISVSILALFMFYFQGLPQTRTNHSNHASICIYGHSASKFPHTAAVLDPISYHFITILNIFTPPIYSSTSTHRTESGQAHDCLTGPGNVTHTKAIQSAKRLAMELLYGLYCAVLFYA